MYQKLVPDRSEIKIDMANTEDNIESLFEKAEIFGKTSIELAKLKLLHTSTKVITALISKLAVFAVLIIFTLILNIGIAFYLGTLTGQVYIGFMIISGFYLLVGLFLHFFLHKIIKKPITELIITRSINNIQ